MQAEPSIVRAENKKEKTQGFLEWMEYTDWVNGKAQLVHEAEATPKLFYPTSKTVSLPVPLKLSDQAWFESPRQDTPPRGSTLSTFSFRGSQEPSEDGAAKKKKGKEKDRCFKCGQFGHYIGECRSNEEEVQVRGRAKSTAGPSAPRDRADSVDVHNRRLARIAEKTEKLASQAKYAASAVKQSRRKFKAKVNAWAKYMPGGTQNTVLTTKDLKELLDTDYSDPDSASLDDSLYQSDLDTDSDEWARSRRFP